jgi:hypothetical protein
MFVLGLSVQLERSWVKVDLSQLMHFQPPKRLRRMTARLLAAAMGMFLISPATVLAAPAQPWAPSANADTVATRLPPPSGYTRLPAPEGSFGAWLRLLPLLPGTPAVKLFDGSQKLNQSAQAAVIDIDVGNRDLQQCADAVMRLRAEYLRAVAKDQLICFRFSDGTDAVWSDWQEGYRARAKGKRMVFEHSGAKDSSYASFRKYMNVVFSYAGTMSLQNELQRVPDVKAILPGDVFIKGGFPGHAVIVLDVAERADGDRMFLLAQSYMPAQQIHVLKNPNDKAPWYHTAKGEPLLTPEWQFTAGSLFRFPDRKCASARQSK